MIRFSWSTRSSGWAAVQPAQGLRDEVGRVVEKLLHDSTPDGERRADDGRSAWSGQGSGRPRRSAIGPGEPPGHDISFRVAGRSRDVTGCRGRPAAPSPAAGPSARLAGSPGVVRVTQRVPAQVVREARLRRRHHAAAVRQPLHQRQPDLLAPPPEPDRRHGDHGAERRSSCTTSRGGRRRIDTPRRQVAARPPREGSQTTIRQPCSDRAGAFPGLHEHGESLARAGGAEDQDGALARGVSGRRPAHAAGVEARRQDGVARASQRPPERPPVVLGGAGRPEHHRVEQRAGRGRGRRRRAGSPPRPARGGRRGTGS